MLAFTRDAMEINVYGKAYGRT